MHSYDILIIGGGVIGASCAYECAKAGHDVLLVDKRACGSGASGSSAAMLELQIDAYRGDPFYSLAKKSRDMFPFLYRELQDLTGKDFQYEQCGILQLALNQADARYLEQEVQRQNALGLKARWLNMDDLQESLPLLNTIHFGGAMYDEDGQVNGELLTSTLIDAAKKKGTVVVENVEELDLQIDNGKVIGIKTKTTSMAARHIVIAAGAWTDWVLSPLQIKLGIEPIRGQLLFYDTQQRFLKYPIYTRSSGYITPKSAGYTLVGTTVEHAGFDETTTEKARLDLQKTATNLIPNFSRKNIRGISAGLRPGSPDGLPFIGPLGSHPNVFVAAGHFRNGILLAPITGKLIAQLISSQQPVIDPMPFSPNRNQTQPLDMLL